MPEGPVRNRQIRMAPLAYANDSNEQCSPTLLFAIGRHGAFLLHNCRLSLGRQVH